MTIIASRWKIIFNDNFQTIANSNFGFNFFFFAREKERDREKRCRQRKRGRHKIHKYGMHGVTTESEYVLRFEGFARFDINGCFPNIISPCKFNGINGMNESKIIFHERTFVTMNSLPNSGKTKERFLMMMFRNRKYIEVTTMTATTIPTMTTK